MRQDVQQIVDRAQSLLRDHPALLVLLVLAATIVTARLVNWVLARVILRWARRTKTELDEHVVELLRQPVQVSIVLAGLGLVAPLVGLPAHVLWITSAALWTVAILVWTAFALRFIPLLLEALSHWEERYRVVQPRTLALFQNLSTVLLAGLGIYFLFLAWRIDVTAWLASAGIIGIAVGFAAKDTLANLFSGVFILADAPYKVGDFINLDTGERGQVTQVGLRSTRLLTRDDVEITIPNAVIANAKIVNESGGPWQKERIRIKVGVAYGSDLQAVRQVLLEAATVHPAVCAEPAPRVRFRAFGDSGLDHELLCWIDEPVLRGRVTDALNTAVYDKLNAAGIEIPYPKRDVYLHWADGHEPRPS